VNQIIVSNSQDGSKCVNCPKINLRSSMNRVVRR